MLKFIILCKSIKIINKSIKRGSPPPFSQNCKSGWKIHSYMFIQRKAEIVRKGKAKGIIGHHINNVKHHPRLAGNPNNIRFVTRKEHYRLHHNGKWRKKTTGKMIKR